MATTTAEDTDDCNIKPLDKKTLDFDEDNLRAIAEVYFQEGNKEDRKKELDNAIYFYTEGINVNCRDDELNAKLYSNRATAHFNLGNNQEALNDARAANGLQPTFIKAIERGAGACVELGLYEEAITWCDKGLAINETNAMLLALRIQSVNKSDRYTGMQPPINVKRCADAGKNKKGPQTHVETSRPVCQFYDLFISCFRVIG